MGKWNGTEGECGCLHGVVVWFAQEAMLPLVYGLIGLYSSPGFLTTFPGLTALKLIPSSERPWSMLSKHIPIVSSRNGDVTTGQVWGPSFPTEVKLTK